MSGDHPMKKYLGAAAGAVLLMAVGAGIAYASIPGPDGVIHACYKNSTGMLIAIDSAASCPSGYTALDWNQTGPQGPPGPGPSAAEVTTSVHYDNPGFDGAAQDPTIVADCPTGKVAVNGGIVRSVADAGWSDGAAAALAVGGSVGPGSAVQAFRTENNGSSADPSNPSNPRSINSGGSWQIAAHLTF